MRSRHRSYFAELFSFIGSVPTSPRAPIVSPTSPPLPPWPGVIHGISTASMHGHVLTFCPTSSWRSTCDLSSRICSAPQAYRSKAVPPGQPVPAPRLSLSLQTGAQVAQPQTSFWPDEGRGKAAPEALRGIPHGTPIGGPAPPGQKRAGVRCTALSISPQGQGQEEGRRGLGNQKHHKPQKYFG